MYQMLSSTIESERFRPEHLLFTRTDGQGVIRSGNAACQRVAGHEVMIGQPHNLVRHPNMPRALFRLMWSELEAGMPFGAYMVNQTKDGKAFTVFAVTMPHADGYVSVRLKPMSPDVAAVKALYDDVTRAERDQGLDVDDSVQLLLTGIRNMGFSSYKAFMAHALERETRARASALHHPPLRLLTSLVCIEHAVRMIEEEGAKVAKLFNTTGQIPYNMRLQATRLEGRDGPIGVISANHQMMSEAFTLALARFLEAANMGSDPVLDAVFLTAAAGLITEVRQDMRADFPANLTPDQAVDLEALVALAAHGSEKSAQAVDDVAARAQFFDRVCKDMRRMVFGLELTRTMCKIERSKVSGDTEGLDEIVARLHHAEEALSDMMGRIETAVHDISDAVDQLKGRGANAARPPVKRQMLQAS